MDEIKKNTGVPFVVYEELETAHRKRVSLQSTGYDMPYIMEQQEN